MADQDMINLAEYLKFKPFPEKLVQNLNNNIKQGEPSQKWNFSRELEWLDAIINLIEFGANPEPVLDQVIQLIDCSDPDVLTKVYLILNHIARSDPDLSLLAINKVLTYSSPSNSQMLFHMDLALNFLCILCEGLDPPTLVKDCFNEIRFNTNAKIKKYYYLGMYNNFKFLKFADLNRLENFSKDLINLFNVEQNSELIQFTLPILNELIDKKLVKINLNNLDFIEFILLNIRFANYSLQLNWADLLTHCWLNLHLEDTTWLLLRIEDLIASFYLQISRNPSVELFLIVSNLFSISYEIACKENEDKDIWKRFLLRNKSKLLKFLSISLDDDVQLEILKRFEVIFKNDPQLFVEDYVLLFCKENTEPNVLKIKLNLLVFLTNSNNFTPIFEYICSIYPHCNMPFNDIVNILVTISKGSEHQFTTLLNHLLLQIESSVSKSESNTISKDPLFSLHLAILSKLYLINKPLINQNIMETIILNCCTAEWDKLTPEGVESCLDLIGWYGTDNPSILAKLESVLAAIQLEPSYPLQSYIYCVISLTYRFPAYYQALLFIATEWIAFKHPDWTIRTGYKPIFTKLFPKRSSDLNHSGLCILSDIEPDKLQPSYLERYQNLAKKQKSSKAHESNFIMLNFELSLEELFELDPMVYSMSKKEFDYLWSSYNTSIRRPIPSLLADGETLSREAIQSKFDNYSIYTLDLEIISDSEFRWKGFTFEKKKQILILMSIGPLPKQSVNNTDVLLTIKSSDHPMSPSLIHWSLRPFNIVKLYSKS